MRQITRKHGRRKRPLCALMGTDFLQQNEARAELSMMKWIWLINHSRSSITLCTSPFSNLPVCILLFFFFFYTTPSKPSPPPLTPPLSSILLPPLFISALGAFSSSPSLFSIAHIFPLSPSPLLVPDLKRTPRQTAEQSDSRDQTFVLNYNPSK